MNLPNRLTLLRIIFIPVMILLYLFFRQEQEWLFPVLGVLFLIASFTDFLDGYLARKYNLVTTFGKFIDPLADKLLVISSLLLLSDYTIRIGGLQMPVWVVILVVARELIVTSIRLVAVSEGRVIAASNLGKAKTFVTMITILYYFFLIPYQGEVIVLIGYLLVGIFTALTIYSGFDYFWANRQSILKTK